MKAPAPRSCVDHHTPTAMLAEGVANKSMSLQHYSPITSVLHAQHRHDEQGFSTTLINGDPAVPDISPKPDLELTAFSLPQMLHRSVMQLLGKFFLFGVALRWLDQMYCNYGPVRVLLAAND